ncbi:MAG: hypothetical protein IJ960_06740 [Oscillospiraceae bacterium]|nr:hypothetical protein [Oscillospiraceae bacterium]
MVYPVWKNKFKISTTGRGEPAMVTIAEMESFGVSIDGNTEEWSPMDAEGWMKRMVTGKALTISLSGKRCIGDAGNDYISSKAWCTGADCESKAEWEFPSGAKLEFDCVINVTNPGGGDSRNVAPLEFELLSDGKPTFTPAAGA